MIETHDYKDRCWWCGNAADSGEHKYKKADLVREFGKGPYKGANELVRGIAGQLRKIQGPNSKEAKFENTLCQICNNERSQPFDTTYDEFSEYIRLNEQKIIAARQFKFSDIFGVDWKDCRLDLLRYYVKHICCRLSTARIFVRQEVIDFLNGAQGLKFLKLNLEIREDIVAMMDGLRKVGMDDGCMWIGDLTCQTSKSSGDISEAQSFLGYRWLRMNYLYDYGIGDTEDNFSGDLVDLATAYNFHPETVRNWKLDP